MKDFEIRCDESRLETTNLIYGKFTLGPFLPGQATTFGNALRRSLLAELSGLAITAFEIIGVMQEFSTLPGLRESILDLSLNLKQIVLTGVLPHSTPPIGFLHVRGPAIIKASDLKLPAGVYCASPNQYIATLGSNGMLHLKFVVSVGKGYSIQPYSIYRSLSKVKLQPSSNFNNTAKNINYAKQVEYESFKDVNLSNAALNPIPLEGKENNITNKETARRPSAAELRLPHTPTGYRGTQSKDSKELYVQNKEGLLSQLAPHATPPRGMREKNSEKELSSISNSCSVQRSKEGSAQLLFRDPNGVRGQQLKNSQGITLAPEGETPCKSSIYSGGISKQLEGSNATLKQRNPVRSSGVLSKNSEGTPKELAFSSKAFPSTSLINEKNSNYINIQTQLFQRITPHQVLPIDAVFTPVSQVNFLTEVNDRFETARENIVLEIWTNGSIHPKRALEEATLSLVQNFDTLLKKIQQASSFYKGLRYWTYLQPFKSSSPILAQRGYPVGVRGKQVYLGEKTADFSVNSVHPDSAYDSLEVEGAKSEKDEQLLRKHEEPYTEMNRIPLQGKGLSSVPCKGKAELANSREIPFAYPVRAVGERLAGGLEPQQEEPLLSQHDQPLLSQELLQKNLPESIYNLDIGNLNLSLQTFIFLKRAKIHTLLQLLTQFSLRQNNILFRKNSHLKSNLLNEKIIEELNDVIKQFGSQD